MSSSYDSSKEEFDMEEEEDLAMILAMYINKKPKHGGSVMGRRKIWMDRMDAHNRLMRHYFVENPTYPEWYFLKEICPRGNNKVVIYIFLYHDKCLLFMLDCINRKLSTCVNT